MKRKYRILELHTADGEVIRFVPQRRICFIWCDLSIPPILKCDTYDEALKVINRNRRTITIHEVGPLDTTEQ
jgi:hypothetical protein